MSIRGRLLLLTLLATLLPAVLVLARFLQERERSIEADTARLAFIAQRRSETIAEKIQGTAQLHLGLARASDLFTNDRDACSAFLAKVLEVNAQYTGILTVKPDGSLFCDSLRTGRQLDLRDRAYFKAALAGREEVILEPAFGRLTGSAVLQIAHPVRSDSGELLFVLLASLNLQPLIEADVLPVPGAQMLLFDDRGVILAKSRSDATADPVGAVGTSMAGSPLFEFVSPQQARASREIVDSGGKVGVWATADAPATRRAGLHVVAGAPRSALVATADRRLRHDSALLAAAALGIFLAVLAVAEFGIRRQVARITRMAQQLAAGDLSARIEPPLPAGELGALMGSLNQTAESLEHQRADIAELNERLRQSQRLEAIGQLTGGVAHDFNNLLTVVLGNAELLVEQYEDSTSREMASMIAAAALRGAELTQRLLAFARKQALDPKVVDLDQLVAGVDAMLRRTLGEHIEIKLIRGASLWPALVDQGQLENALLNLCVNARDAMPRGGRLTIETENALLDTEYADGQLDVAPGAYVLLAVSDTGEGIAPENLKRVFEPFFTTKETGKGTGLGLAMVYGFVKQSAGHVAIYSEPGQGTTVKIFLPRAAVAGEAPVVPAAEQPIGGGHESILLVEDDDGVRRQAHAQLRSLGYRVIEATDAPSALALIEQHEDLDLLFTDVVMPGGMNGRALADAAHLLRPGLRVLFTSGYTESAIVHHGRLDPGALLLSKPYRRGQLDRAVRDALASPPPMPPGRPNPLAKSTR
jgi:signal transduction histidine kinase/ActR/RegA family two-component response regulator